MNSLVSAIIPVYIKNDGVLALFKNTLRGLISQTYKNIEIILVTNGMTDSEIKKVSSICNDKRIKLYNLKNVKNFSKALNFGFSKSSGDFVNFHDQDDISDITKYEKLLASVGEDGIIASNIYVIKGQEKRLKGFDQNIIMDRFVSRKLVKAPVHYGSLILKKEIVNDSGGFENVLTADSLFCIKVNLLRYFSLKCKINVIYNPLFSWIRHSGSITMSNKNAFTQDADKNRNIIIQNHEKIINSSDKEELKKLMDMKDNLAECVNIEFNRVL